jgi:hypothetical protein
MAWPARLCPHLGQNFAPGAAGVPHSGQGFTALPHLAQNFASPAVGAWQLGQEAIITSF